MHDTAQSRQHDNLSQTMTKIKQLLSRVDLSSHRRRRRFNVHIEFVMIFNKGKLGFLLNTAILFTGRVIDVFVKKCQQNTPLE